MQVNSTHKSTKLSKMRYFGILIILIAVAVSVGNRNQARSNGELPEQTQKPTPTPTPTPTPCPGLCPCVCPPGFPVPGSGEPGAEPAGTCPRPCKCECGQPGGTADAPITTNGGSVTLRFGVRNIGQTWDSGGRLVITKQAFLRDVLLRIFTPADPLNTVTERRTPLSGRFTVRILTTLADGSSPEPITIRAIPVPGNLFGEATVTLEFSTVAFPKVVEGKYHNPGRRIASVTIKDEGGAQGSASFTLPADQCTSRKPCKVSVDLGRCGPISLDECERLELPPL